MIYFVHVMLTGDIYYNGSYQSYSTDIIVTVNLYGEDVSIEDIKHEAVVKANKKLNDSGSNTHCGDYSARILSKTEAFLDDEYEWTSPITYILI